MIKKLDIDLFDGVNKTKYNRKRAEYIAKWTSYRPGGFFSPGVYAPDPAGGEASWNSLYPDGYESWANNQLTLNSKGEQMIINKIDEIVDVVNKLHKKKS